MCPPALTTPCSSPPFPAPRHAPLPAFLQIALGALGKVVRVPRFAAAEPPAGGDSSASAAQQSMRVVAAHVLNVSWSADHRVVDGATLARFSNAFKGHVESPLQLLL